MLGFDAVQTEVISRLGNRSDITARSVRWINYAFFEILLNPRFSFFELDRAASFVTTAGVNFLDIIGLAGDLWFILDIVDQDNSRHLTRSHFQVIDRVVATTGQITRYFRFGNFVQFDPTPDAQYNMLLRYRRRPPDQSSGANFQGLGTEWEEPIIVLATIKGFEALDQRAKAQEQRQIFEAILPTRQDVPTLEDADAETTIAPQFDYRMGTY